MVENYEIPNGIMHSKRPASEVIFVGEIADLGRGNLFCP
jgi:hypothetical protein